jgi:hypothetical protein
MNTEFLRFKDGSISIHFKHMTKGEVLALCNALVKHNTTVCEDVRNSLRNAIQRKGKSDEDQMLFSLLRE